MKVLGQLSHRVLPTLLASLLLSCGQDAGSPGQTPTKLALVRGDGQSGPAGQMLAESLVVAVTTDNSDPVAGVEVSWVAAGGGTVSAERMTTGSDGRAAVARELGTVPGEATTTASVADLQGSPVTFHHTVVPAAGSLSILVQPASAALDHEVFDPARQPVVVVRDTAGAPVAGALVTAGLASGAGALEGGISATTDAEGRAVFADLGVTGAAGPYTVRFVSGATDAVSDPINLAPLPTEAATGSWTSPSPWPIVPLHMHLLPTGKILAWGKFGQPQLWDPVAGSFREVPVDSMLFCAGHAFLPDGRLLVSGGHFGDDRGLRVTRIFDPFSESWITDLPHMHWGRWYPTVTALPDGRMLTMAGRDSLSRVDSLPEVWNGTEWVVLSSGLMALPYYPRNFVAPDGRIFYAGERVRSWWLDISANGGTGQWIGGPSHVWPYERDYGSAVSYRPGKILYAGGGGNLTANRPHDSTTSTPTNTAEVIDLNDASPAWRSTASMAFARRFLQLTILPAGDVLATGGTSGGGFDDFSDANGVHAAELWDPATGAWTTLASSAITRVYHSVSLLLPDGRVIHAGSGDAMVNGVPAPDQRSGEIFSPPYLFRGSRPVIDAAPPEVGYGAQFTVATPNARQITRVTWIRLASVSHSFDQNQRFNELEFQVSSNGVTVTAPARAALAPPGHYQLFLLNRNGVPSAGKVVRIQ